MSVSYQSQKEKITIEPEEKSGMIRDAVSNKWIKKTPEEEVRQLYIQKLIKEYKYPKSYIKTEVKIISGQTETKKRADIVVFRDDKNFRPEENAYLVIELKKKDRKDGEDQLKSYINSTTAEFGVWFNGKDIAYFQYVKDPRKHLEIPDIPKYGESLKDIGLYKKKDLTPASELKTVFETIHNHIYANEGYLKDKVFNEVLKLIFIKMVDEKSSNADCDFRITVKEREEIESGGGIKFRGRIKGLFEKVKKDFGDIFDSTDKIILETKTLAFAVGQFQKYHLGKTEADIKGVAFQTFVHAHSRGERGEFFTPYPILNMVVEMLSPQDNESIIDPACGSGGFLVQTLNYVRRTFEKNRSELSEQEIINNVKDYAIHYLRGIDFNPDLTRVAKMYMVLYDDGHTGIFSHNSLNDLQKIFNASHHQIQSGSFNIIMTNPPFGSKGKVTDKKILDDFELGHKWKKGDEKWERTLKIAAENGNGGQVPDILFIERCLQFLKNGGRMAIVLPDGDLTNSSLGYVRQWIKNNAKILAVISLPQETFVPYGAGVKASVLFLQKLPEEELEKIKKKDYPIFMGIVEKIGYDIRGRAIYKRDEKGEVIKKDDKKVVDEDVSLVIEEFKKFKEKYNVNFH